MNAWILDGWSMREPTECHGTSRKTSKYTKCSPQVHPIIARDLHVLKVDRSYILWGK